jgi:membrane protease YdiL (CAAX protease family)
MWAAAIPYVTVVIGLYVFNNAWVAFLPYHVAIVVVLALYGELAWLKKLKEGFSVKPVLLTGLPCLVAGVLIYALWPIASIEGCDLDEEINAMGFGGGLWFVMIAYSFVINPWFEEAFWRGFLGSKKRGLVVTDFLFAGYHILVLVLYLRPIWIVVAAIMLTGGAWFWRQLASRYKGLAVAAVTHLVADIGIMTAIHHLRI